MSYKEKNTKGTIKDRLLVIKRTLHRRNANEVDLRENESLDWADFNDWNNGPTFKDFASTPGWERDWNRGW